MKRKSVSESSREPKKFESNTRRRSISMFLTERSTIDDEPFADTKPNLKKIGETEEGNRLEDGSKHAEANIKVFPCAEVEPKAAVTCAEAVEAEVVTCAEAETKALLYDELVCEKNSLPSENNPGKVTTSDNTEKGAGGLKKEVKSRNLLWFLQKTKDLKTSIS